MPIEDLGDIIWGMNLGILYIGEVRLPGTGENFGFPGLQICKFGRAELLVGWWARSSHEAKSWWAFTHFRSIRYRGRSLTVNKERPSIYQCKYEIHQLHYSSERLRQTLVRRIRSCGCIRATYQHEEHHKIIKLNIERVWRCLTVCVPFAPKVA